MMVRSRAARLPPCFVLPAHGLAAVPLVTAQHNHDAEALMAAKHPVCRTVAELLWDMFLLQASQDQLLLFSAAG